MAGQVKIASSATGATLSELVKEYGGWAASAVRAGVGAAETGMLAAMRGELADEFPGSRRIATAITGATYPEAGVSLSAAAFVRPRGAKVGAMLAAHQDGAKIQTRGGGLCLAIPTGAVPRVSGRKMTPDEVRRRYGRHLELIAPKPGSGAKAWGYLVLPMVVRSKSGRLRRASLRDVRADRRNGTSRVESVVMFVLVPEIQLPKRLNPERIAQEWADRVPGLIERAASRLGT